MTETNHALCIFKQYTNVETKPLYLHCAETIHVTMSGSLGFIVALAWNEFFKMVIENMTTHVSGIARGVAQKREVRVKLVYALIATAFLFLFNIGYSSVLNKMRIHVQKTKTFKMNNEKATRKSTKKTEEKNLLQ